MSQYKIERRANIWIFLVWLAIFYTSWLGLVILIDGWQTLLDHWPIAVSMALGSYFAGSTPMGGGTVGFPVLTLLFDYPASMGRNFGLAVQSIGMVSASVYILAVKRPIDTAILIPALVGAAIATPLGAAFLAPGAPDLLVKLIFAVIWAGFGVIHWIKIADIVRPVGLRISRKGIDTPIGLAIGLSGGIIASLTGIGIDMLVYAVLVLFYRSDLKVAVPTSVILMAFTSVIGISSNALLSFAFPTTYVIEPAVFLNWLAAAPVVAIGAPIGAIVVERLSRRPTLLLVSTLCIAQFVWTLVDQQVGGRALIAALGALVLVCGFFLYLFRLGHPHSVTVIEDNRPTAATAET